MERPRNLEASRVKGEAAGRWSRVYARLTRGKLDEAMRNAGRHVPCPVHSESVDGFRLFKDWEETGGGICNTCGAKHDGFAVLQWLMGWSFPDTVAAVAEAVGMISGCGFEDLPDRTPKSAARKPQPTLLAEDEAKRRRLREVWSGGLRLTDPAAAPLDLYFRRRGLDLRLIRNETVFRLHPRLPLYNDVKDVDRRTGAVRKFSRHVGDFACWLSMVFDKQRRPLTILRTFITEDGYAAPGKNKKVMAIPSDRSASGGAILWGKRTPDAHVAEGQENAFSVTMATGRTCLPLVSSSWMVNWEVPEGIERVTIWGDIDRNGAGQKYGRLLQQRVWEQGVPAQTEFPRMPIHGGKASVDWNDVWVMYGRDGFPQVQLAA
ncbi:MAG: toprim domain-containing protein [Parvibaculum sp.]